VRASYLFELSVLIVAYSCIIAPDGPHMKSSASHCHTKSVFDRLPQELVLEIYDWLKFLNPGDIDAALRTFLSVCQSLRRAVISCPILWGHIHHRLAPSLRKSKWLLLKLERSQDSSIQLFIRSEISEGGSLDSPDMEPLLESCERWEELHVFITYPIAQCFEFLAPIEGRLPRLRRLVLSMDPRSWTPRGVLLPPCFKHAPLLNDVSLPYLPERVLSSFSLQQLIRCEINVPGPDHSNYKAKGEIAILVATLLRPDSKLQTLKITQRTDLNRDWDYGLLESLQLRYLELRDHRRSPLTIDDPTNAWKDNAECFLQCLTAPQIQHIVAHCPYLQPSTLLGFMKRSGCSLKVLDLGQTFLDPVIVELLSTTSATSLTHLHIQISRLVDLRSFPKFKDLSFLPNLTSWILSMAYTPRGSTALRLSEMYDPPVDQEGMVELLNSIGAARCEALSPAAPGKRFQFGPRLKHFQIEWDNAMHPRAYAQLLARLPLDSCGADRSIVDVLKRYSGRFARLYEATRGAEIDGIIEDLADLFSNLSLFQKVSNAQYLYVSAFIAIILVF